VIVASKSKLVLRGARSDRPVPPAQNLHISACNCALCWRSPPDSTRLDSRCCGHL